MSVAPLRRRSLRPKSMRRDFMAALTSGFVGALALATSLYNVYLQRQQVKAQVWPKLVVQDSADGTYVGVAIANRGVGPADIRRVRVLVDGLPSKSWLGAFKALRRRDDLLLPRSRSLLTTLAPGQEVVFVSYPPPDWFELVLERERVVMQVCYCSTLDDCWELTSPWGNTGTGDVTRVVSECRPDPAPFLPITLEESARMIEHHLSSLREEAGGDAAVDAHEPK